MNLLYVYIYYWYLDSRESLHFTGENPRTSLQKYILQNIEYGGNILYLESKSPMLAKLVAVSKFWKISYYFHILY